MVDVLSLPSDSFLTSLFSPVLPSVASCFMSSVSALTSLPSSGSFFTSTSVLMGEISVTGMSGTREPSVPISSSCNQNTFY